MNGIGLHPEYIRDMHNHYMVLKGDKENKSNYTAKMLMNNSVPGILQTELRYLDSLDLYYYDITSKKTLKSLYESKPMEYEITKQIINDVLQIIEKCEEYLLVEHEFIITPDFVFLDSNNQVGLCYMPGFDNNIFEQLSFLFEYIMNKIDYKDESAVRLIYALYKESKDVECTFYKLYEVIKNPHTTKGREKKEQHAQETKEPTLESMNLLKPLLLEGKYLKNEEKRNDNKKKVIGETKSKTKREYKSKAINEIMEKSRLKKQSRSQNNKSHKDKSHKDKSQQHQTQQNQTEKKQIQQNHRNQIKNNLSEKSLSNTISNIIRRIPDRFKRNTNIQLENYHIKGEVDKGEVVNEREVFYFCLWSYLVAGGSIVVGIILLLVIYFSGLINNPLGNDVNTLKFFACILVVVCTEIYLMTKLFDPNKKLTKMETVLEYINEIQVDNVIEEREIVSEKVIKEESDDITKEKEEHTQILWKQDSITGEEKTQVLTYFEESKSFYLTPIKTKATDNEKITKVKISEYPFYIGKSPSLSNMVIVDNSISRRHGVITCMEDKILYTDLESTNGTFLNGNKLECNKTYNINIYDELSFANIKYIWEELES